MVQTGDIVKDGGAIFKVKKFTSGDGGNTLIGSVTWYAGYASIPENYLLCDGSAISREDYADLFTVIGTTYGVGDSSTTFNLPLLTDNRFIEGSVFPGTQHEAGLPNITGEKYWAGVSTEFANSKGALSGKAIASGYTWIDHGYTGYTLLLDASKSNPIYGASLTVQPQSLTLIPLIKYI